MSKINPKLDKEIFSDEVLSALPSNDKIKFGIGMAKRSLDPVWIENNKKANKARYDDPEFAKRMTENNKKLAQDPIWIEAKKQGQSKVDWKSVNQKKAQDPIWIDATTKASQAKAQDPNWLAKTTANNRAKTQDAEYMAKITKVLQDRSQKPFVTPEGVFDSVKSAQEHYNVLLNIKHGGIWLRKQKKKFPNGYYHISKEEYIMLTGKE